MRLLSHATVVYLAATLIVGACQPSDRSPVTVADVTSEARPDHESWDVSFDVSEMGDPRVSIQADYMAEFSAADSQYTLLQTLDATKPVNAVIHNPESPGQTTITTNELRYFERDKKFEALGNVRVQTDDRTLFTEHLFWYEDDERIHAPGFVRFSAPDEQVEGFSLDADEDLTNYKIARVTVQVLLDE